MDYEISEYEDIIYYAKDNAKVGDFAYAYDIADDRYYELKIIEKISRSCDTNKYEELVEGVEFDNHEGDFCCELITDNDCYLLWFKFIEIKTFEEMYKILELDFEEEKDIIMNREIQRICEEFECVSEQWHRGICSDMELINNLKNLMDFDVDDWLDGIDRSIRYNHT